MLLFLPRGEEKKRRETFETIMLFRVREWRERDCFGKEREREKGEANLTLLPLSKENIKKQKLWGVRLFLYFYPNTLKQNWNFFPSIEREREKEHERNRGLCCKDSCPR